MSQPVAMPTAGITEDWLRAVVERLSDFTVVLDPDPIKYGPKALQKKVALQRRYQNELQRYQSEVLKEIRSLNKRIRLAETQYSMDLDDLLANDESVSAKPSIRDREALAGSMLKASQDAIETMKTTLADLEAVGKIFALKASNLKGTNSDLRLQKQLIQQELDIGSHWGEDNVSEPGRVVRMPDPVDERGEVVESLLSPGESASSYRTTPTDRPPLPEDF